MEQSGKKNLLPKAAAITAEKESFISALRQTGGNVSKALLLSNLARKTAYAHLQNDKAFADAWMGAVEEYHDELLAEARRRAVEGEVSGNSVRKSDSLLIYLLKQKSATKRRRARLIETGNIALESVRLVGLKNGLSEEIIVQMQKEVLDKFKAISVV